MIGVMYKLFKHLDEDGYALCIKALHLMLISVAHTLPATIFSQAVELTINITKSSTRRETLQYCSDCILIFTEQENCKKRQIVSEIIDALPKYLMSSDDGLTCYNAFFSCGNIFFLHLCRDRNELTVLLNNFLRYGAKVKCPDSIVGLPYALAKLSQEKALFGILTQQNMLGKALDLCLYILSTSPRKPIVQGCSLIALARTVAQIPSVEPMVRTQIAANFHEWLKTTNEKVLV